MLDRAPFGWLAVGLVFLLGLSLGLVRPPAIDPWIKPAVGGLMILSSLMLLIGSKTLQGPKLKTRVLAVGLMVMGVSYMVPDSTAKLVITSAMAAVMVAAALGRPKRLFAPKAL